MTTLEKIKAEVKNIVDFVAVNGEIYVREYDVVQIIDKYAEQETKGEEECLKSEKEIVQTASGTIRPVRGFTVKK